MMKTKIDLDCHDERVSDEPSSLPGMFGSELGASSLPTRGLCYSSLAHVAVVVAFLYVPWSSLLPGGARLASAQSVIQMHEVLLLPTLEPTGSGASAASSESGDSKREEEAAARSAEAKAIRGVVYKGPQLVVSDPPRPDNFVQTIQQPGRSIQPKLPSPLPLPPLVSMAAANPELAPPAAQSLPDVPRENLPAPILAAEPFSLHVEAPKLPLPPPSSNDLAQALANVTVPMPKLEHRVAKTNAARNVLIVNAFSVPDQKAPAIPSGELYGSFTVSPVGATAAGPAGGGTETKGVPGIGDGSGETASASADEVTTPSAGVAGKSTGGGGESRIARAGVGSGTGTGRLSAGNGKGTGSGSGGGVHTSGNGSAPGAGSGSSPFPAIMIQGGSGGGSRGLAAAPGAMAAQAQTKYEITIVASGASGGGFKDFGVFRNEASYTVYLDMADAGMIGSTWTLQYALYVHPAQNSSVPAERAHGLVVPPYATLKSLPRFSAEAAGRGRGGTIVVFGVINPQGRFEDLKIMQSPDALLNQFLLDALSRWTFRPAEVDGTQVPVKILLGVPVDSVSGE
ncbi:MAG: energy transducer TonB [Candidatus Korobacteraceae bacterium]|jgi:TonB family protein